MSDNTANIADHGADHHAHRAPKAEYIAYFAILFLVGIPFQMVIWTVLALRHGKLPGTGPVGRAWKEAQTITPMIFLG